MTCLENTEDYLMFIKFITLKGLTDRDRKKPYWGNLPITVNKLKGLYHVYKPNMKFLDLGCGVGNVLRYAKNIGYDVFGVEFNEELTRYLGDYNFIIKDITKLEDNFYSDFDIIYAYRPLKNEFESYINKVVNNMKSGSYIFTPTFNINNKNLEEVSPYFYKKK